MSSLSAKNGPQDFRTANGHGYILNGGHIATARLSLQHFFWQRCLRFNIHPSLTPHLPPKPQIADVAAGMALWAIETAEQFPQAEVTCYDIDTSQAPPSAWRPANLHVAEPWDFHTEPPPEARGKYDLVHIRLMVLVLSGTDPLPVVRRLAALLKPGGWLQWEDIDCTVMHVKRVAAAGLETPALDGIIDMTRSDGRHDWVARLPEILMSTTETGTTTTVMDKSHEKKGEQNEGQGEEGKGKGKSGKLKPLFANASMEANGDPVELCRAFNDQHLMTMQDFAAGLFRIGKTEPGQKLLDMVRDGYEESLRGAAISYPRVCCVAKRT